MGHGERFVSATIYNAFLCAVVIMYCFMCLFSVGAQSHYVKNKRRNCIHWPKRNASGTEEMANNTNAHACTKKAHACHMHMPIHLHTKILRCTQEFVLVTFLSYRALTNRLSITISHFKQKL